jgi:hypothetical protein
MLTKMSKITDLISKLDDFASGEDQSRVKKCSSLPIPMETQAQKKHFSLFQSWTMATTSHEIKNFFSNLGP